ncbi:MAG: MBL fold metallo-hydrolase [Anaerolineae bacterium]|nr:MBL fold metallo-hydrolase [Anaerolineae bacterium]
MDNIAPNVYVSTGRPGTNAGCIVLPEGIVAVDAPTLPQDAQAWRGQLDSLGKPILYLVLTDSNPERLLGAGVVSDDGRIPIVATRATYMQISTYSENFWRLFVENWAHRYPHHAPPPSSPVLPELMFTHSLILCRGGSEVKVEHVAGATPDSAWVYFPEQDVLFAGDTVVVGTPPIMGATPDSRAWLETLARLTHPRFSHTRIVPGRGPVCDQSAVAALSDYLARARQLVRTLGTNEQGRVDYTPLIAELLSPFTIAEGELELMQRRVKAGLERLLEEVRAESTWP